VTEAHPFRLILGLEKTGAVQAGPRCGIASPSVNESMSVPTVLNPSWKPPTMSKYGLDRGGVQLHPYG
ncbi:MAG: hypothetical protein ACOC6O_02025, partial [Chloroflexota bacterium]